MCAPYVHASESHGTTTVERCTGLRVFLHEPSVSIARIYADVNNTIQCDAEQRDLTQGNAARTYPWCDTFAYCVQGPPIAFADMIVPPFCPVQKNLPSTMNGEGFM